MSTVAASPPRTATAARERRRARMTKLIPWISTLLSIVLLVVIWKLVIAIFDVSPFVLPQPEDVLKGV